MVKYKIWQKGQHAIRQNIVPGLTLLVFGIVLILSYYRIQPVAHFLNQLASLKEQSDYGFAILSTALFGGIIPYLYQLFSGQIPKNAPVLSMGVFLFIFYAYRGFEVDLLYRFQDKIFGNGLTFSTIFKKTVVDQFIYAPFWSIPMVTIGLMFRNYHLSWSAMRPALNRKFLTNTIPAVILATWVIWIPGVAIIYSFPLSLQIPIMNLIVCFYTLMMLKMAKKAD